jgi:4-hydroxy-3-methylbut-2-enyl diphosphate reductase|tara:strand:- start:134 stop:973 length:840 start_codon:yes stop_codon:yes gene_type:complete
MNITVAKDAGYCFGVRDAVNLAYDTAKKYGSVYMLGDIVHNEQVVKDLEKAGAKVVGDISEIPDDSPVLFRAHGTKNNLWKEAKKRNLNIIDATCPLVHEIHREVKHLEEEGRKIIIIGDHGHDEVIAIADQVKKPLIVSSKAEAEAMRRTKRAGIVTQSTQMIENVQEVINVIMNKVYDLRFVNTICFPTKRNHEQIKDMAEENDIMIIIGSFTSANSKRLTELSKQRNKKSYQVTCAEDLDIDWFQGVKTVGISAGASTPDYLIDEVKNKIQFISKD